MRFYADIFAILHSAVEKRRTARKNISVAVIVLILSLILISIGKIFALAGFFGVFYTIYKGFFKGILCLWIYKE
ncbi:hypothetical protein [Moraxella bovis]|uniref:hypothetical protein n=1 Tax=Moraxella bovis TaxID=476 RepID=UPI0022263947|nr:hypothetical protein [Moraxella bovis]UYZ98956.1 hypothetical protein LP107_06040 [Moraxella bovis]UZA23311.1 hypothetical protein LP106_06045 [Moraxella bovis]UZA44502.1 hypothetical protein LP128_07830 [Moraxella bovis]UZA58242.1 hypothetical protein LP127_06375 [Moraxella bovis]UZA60840.1 hypothetical protein LP116_06440 [Moraxella bovis]